jgi:hypothetical protein
MRKIAEEHIHRRPKKHDFQGKTIKRFVRSGDNIWRFWFTDGTAFAIQSDIFYGGLACMEICDQCVTK